MEDAFSLDEALEPVASVDGLAVGEESTKAVSLALVEGSFVMDVALVKTFAFSLFEAVDDFPSEFGLFELVLANGCNDVSSRSDFDSVLFLFLIFLVLF